MKRKFRFIGGWVGSGILLMLAFAGIGLVSGAKIFTSSRREGDGPIT